jgi:hypothetical protein
MVGSMGDQIIKGLRIDRIAESITDPIWDIVIRTEYEANANQSTNHFKNNKGSYE